MIFLHCGLRKTGSTAIQSAGEHGRIGGVRYSRRSRTELAETSIDEKWARRVTRAAETENVLLSCENTFRRTEFHPVEEPRKRAAYLLDTFGDGETTFIVYVRPILPWLESMYFQSLQNRWSLSPTEFLDRFTAAGALQIHDKLASIADVAGRDRLIVRIHDSSVDSVADISSVMGAQLRGGPGERTNESLAHRDIWTLAAVNRTDPRLCWYAVDRLRRRAHGGGHEPRRSVFSEEQQAHIAERYRAEWMSLAPFVSADGETAAALRSAWDRSLLDRPLPVSVPDADAQVRAEELARRLRRPLGIVDTRIIERIRHWDRLKESFRWRLKIGF